MRLGFDRTSLAVDLGNNNTLLSNRNNILLDEPSVIVLNKESESIFAVGGEAYEMMGKTHQQLKTIRPLRSGVIADYESTRKMLQAFVRKVQPGNRLFRSFDNIITGVPYASTEVERRALRDALEQFSASKTYLIYEPIAAAIGMGLNIKEPDGKFIIDIGGGITEIVVISLSGVVSYQCIKVGGDSFNEDIQEFFRKRHNMAIGLKEAETAKHKAGAAISSISEAPEPHMVAGKDLLTGVPKKVLINHEQIAQVLDKTLGKIDSAAIQALEECLPELAGDIYVNGIYLTGGGSLLRGVKERLERKTKLTVYHDEHALYSVSKGISKVLNSPVAYKGVLFE